MRHTRQNPPRERQAPQIPSVAPRDQRAEERRGTPQTILANYVEPKAGTKVFAKPDDQKVTKTARGPLAGAPSLFRKSLCRNGRGGIRTHGTLLTYTSFPGLRLKPLGHPSSSGLS